MKVPAFNNDLHNYDPDEFWITDSSIPEHYLLAAFVWRNHRDALGDTADVIAIREARCWFMKRGRKAWGWLWTAHHLKFSSTTILRFERALKNPPLDLPKTYLI